MKHLNQPRGISSIPRLLMTALTICLPNSWAGENSLNFDEVIGLTVTVENSENCDGSNPNQQTVTNVAEITGGGGGCPVKLAITVTGLVETQDAPYDYVYVNDVLFFSGVDANTECVMTTKTVTKVVTVSPDEGITLTYDTSDGQFHAGAYATITNVESQPSHSTDVTVREP